MLCTAQLLTSRGVVAEMMRKNLRQRPTMRWQVMDMLHTKVLPSGSNANDGELV